MVTPKPPQPVVASVMVVAPTSTGNSAVEADETNREDNITEAQSSRSGSDDALKEGEDDDDDDDDDENAESGALESAPDGAAQNVGGVTARGQEVRARFALRISTSIDVATLVSHLHPSLPPSATAL